MVCDKLYITVNCTCSAELFPSGCTVILKPKPGLNRSLYLIWRDYSKSFIKLWIQENYDFFIYIIYLLFLKYCILFP